MVGGGFKFYSKKFWVKLALRSGRFWGQPFFKGCFLKGLIN